VITGTCLIGFSAWDIVDGWIKAWRASRRAAAAQE